MPDRRTVPAVELVGKETSGSIVVFQVDLAVGGTDDIERWVDFVL